MDILSNKLSLSEQERILTESHNSKIPLASILAKKGLSYDSLRYREYPNMEQLQLAQDSNETIDEVKMYKPSIPAVSFFSGAGGLDIGFEYAGFNNIVSIEFNEVFCNTLRKNNPSKIVLGPPTSSGDVRKREVISTLLQDIIGKGSGFDGVFHGGPPCQPFSIAANQRFSKNGSNFKRQGFNDENKGELIFDYLWYIREFKPKAFLIENVAGIEDFNRDNKIKNALDALTSLGYDIHPPRIINAANYGVPQNRIRWLIIGTRTKKNLILPKPNAHVTSCFSTFTRSLIDVKNHQTREHTAESISRYMLLSYGARDKLGRVDRLNPYLPSKTVIAGGTKGGGRSHLHPYSPRTLSVRESARLQTFPDSYIFTGSTARQFTQAGNAVPPLLAYKIALQMKKCL